MVASPSVSHRTKGFAMLRSSLFPAALILLAAVALPGAPVHAQTAVPEAGAGGAPAIDRQGAADDGVMLELSVEDWVETDTATVRLGADLAVEAGKFGAARQDLVATLQGFGTGAEWRIVDFGKLGDDAGFERWRLVAEARVPEAALAELAGKAREATRPGRALSVASIEYTPTLAEREAVVDRLRARIYGRVARELAALNGAFADRDFRIRMIDFTTGFRPQPRMMTMARAEQAGGAMKMADAGGGLAGAEKATLTARVTLAAVAPTE
jgi:hypothetical protein